MSTHPRILVTGAAVRVGRATALALAERGHDLILTFHSSGEECRRTAELCREVAPRSIDVRVLELHLESERSVLDVCDEILSIGIDGVVHNLSLIHI